MRIPLMSSYLGILLLAAFGDPRAATETKYLMVPLFAQEANNWCWAASDQMVLAYYSYYPPQCSIAENHLHGGCCPTAQGGACDVPSDSHIAAYFPRTIEVERTLSFLEIKNEIKARRPIIFSKDWTNGGHLMVALGFKETSAGIQYIYRNNSIGPSTTLIRYEEYAGGSGWGYANKTNFFNIF
jgi:hypothetical protein